MLQVCLHPKQHYVPQRRTLLLWSVLGACIPAGDPSGHHAPTTSLVGVITSESLGILVDVRTYTVIGKSPNPSHAQETRVLGPHPISP